MQEETTPKKRGVNSYLVILLALLLTGVIVYLLSEINHSRYFVVVRAGQLTVEQGRLFPFGSTPFKPEDPQLAMIYAPVTIPSESKIPNSQAFDSLSELDRHLFAIFAGWARGGLQSNNVEEFEEALIYIDKARRLPGLSGEQQRELNLLRGDISYRDGKRLVNKAVDDMKKAFEAFRVAHELGTSRPTDSYRWMVELEGRIKNFPQLDQQQGFWQYSQGTQRPQNDQEQKQKPVLPPNDTGKTVPSHEIPPPVTENTNETQSKTDIK